jgi:hypothetical protein
VLQAVFRFSREGEGATVYVHTNALPEWVPLAAGPDECSVEKRSPGERGFLNALSKLQSARASEIVEAMEDSVTRQWVHSIGNRLATEGVVSKCDDPSHSQANLFELTGEFNPYGRVELPEPESENRKPSRIETTTSEFTVSEDTRPWWQCDGWREERDRLKRQQHRLNRQIETEAWRTKGTTP